MKFLTKIPKWLRQLLIVEFIIALIAILAFCIPMSMSSGVEKFSGKERVVAEFIERQFGTLLSDQISFPYIRLTIDNVKAQSKKDSVSFCKDNIRTLYRTTVTERTVFGIPQAVHEGFPTCE